MPWDKVYNLIRSCGGNIQLADPAEIAAATAEGPGDSATQIQIAQIEYARQIRKYEQGKEANDGQERWNFS